MSTHPEKPTAERKWTKVLMVAVPTFIGLMSLSYFCQFTEPDVSFIPKNATVERYFRVLLFNGRSTPNSFTEVTEAKWKTTQVKEQLKQYLSEIRVKGYREEILPGEQSEYRVFINVKGDRIMLRPIWDPGQQGFEFTFSHKETRPVHLIMKRNIRHAFFGLTRPY